MKYRIPYIDNLEYKKKSNTLFILGSGSSVNEVTSQQWNLIRQHDSIGFNNWVIHDFVPDLYMFEFDFTKVNGRFQVDEKTMREGLFHNLNVKKDEYKNLKMIFKMDSSFSQNPLPLLDAIPIEVLKNLYFSPVISLAYHDKNTLTKALRISSQYFNKYEHLIHVHTRASIFDLLLFGAELKFENIVLIGIDLTTEYFYEDEQYRHYEKIKNLRVPDMGKVASWYSNYKSQNVHDTERTDVMNGIPISHFISEINKIILQPRGTKLYVSSKSSRLYPTYPCYF